MGYGFQPIAIKLDELKKVRGCKDAALLAAMIDSGEVPDDDDDPDEYELLDDEEDDDDEGPESLPTSADALRHIIMGESYARGIGAKYGYVAMAICEHLGERLPNNMWGRTRGEFVEAFDRALGKLGVPKSVLRLESHFWGRRDPIELPRRNDFPSIGHLTRKECEAALAALESLTPEAVQKAGTGLKTSRGEVEASFFRDSLDEIIGWCRTCVESERDLVVFYH